MFHSVGGEEVFETLRNSDSDENETFRLSRAAWVRSVLLACPQSP